MCSAYHPFLSLQGLGYISYFLYLLQPQLLLHGLNLLVLHLFKPNPNQNNNHHNKAHCLYPVSLRKEVFPYQHCSLGSLTSSLKPVLARSPGTAQLLPLMDASRCSCSFLGVWTRGHCWPSLPLDTALSCGCQATLSPGPRPSHAVPHVAAALVFRAPLPPAWCWHSPGFSSWPPPPILPHASVSLDDYIPSRGYSPHLSRPNLIQTESTHIFEIMATGRVEFDSGQVLDPQHYLPMGLCCVISGIITKKRFNQCYHIAVQSLSLSHCSPIPNRFWASDTQSK